MSATLALWLVAFSAPGCSGGPPSLGKQDDTADDEDPDTDEESDQPAEVSGAFLHCAELQDFPEIPVTEDEAIVACIVKDAAGNRYQGDLGQLNVKIVLSDGTEIQPAAKENNSAIPWHVYFKVKKEQLKDISSITMDFFTALGAQVQTKTDNTGFDYSNDPVFKDAINAAEAILYEKFGPVINALEPESQPLIPPPANAKHLIFVTQKIYPATTGLAGADKICAEAGKRVDKERSWLALLSTSKIHARDRLPIIGPVYNVMGDLFAESASEMYSNAHGHVRFTEYGDDSGRALIKSLGIKVNRTWTGSDKSGRYHAELGACNDWTSDTPEINTAVGSSIAFDDKWLWQEDRISCSHLGRFYCISK